jgi:hypothetical protein
VMSLARSIITYRDDLWYGRTPSRDHRNRSHRRATAQRDDVAALYSIISPAAPVSRAAHRARLKGVYARP